MSKDLIRVVILGGGFSAVYAAKYLEKALGKRGLEKVRITLVARENYLTFQPMLPEIIGGHIDLLHAVSPIRRLARRTQVYTREIEAIDLQARTVTLAPGFRPKPLVLQYDHLVIGMGMMLDCSKVPGSAEHALPFKYLGDALRLRNQIVRVLEEADIELDPAMKEEFLTFVVAGGGFSGVECAAEINEFLREAVRSYQNIRESDFRVVLLQSADHILPELKPQLGAFAHRLLVKRGMEIRLNTRLTAVSADYAVVQQKGGGPTESIATRTVVTTVPAGPHPIIRGLPCKLEKDRIRVDEFMQVPGQPGVWALGDCALVMQKDGMFSPPTAQHAIRQAKTCATNVAAAIRGEAKRTPFGFTGLGKLASLGRGSAVAEVAGLRFSGLFAWFLWRSIYLLKFPGLDRQWRIATDWTLDMFLPKDITEVRIFKADDVCMEHFEPGETVFDQGDHGDKVYFIARGSVEIVRDGIGIAELRDGEIFGEIALISDKPRNASVRAATALDVVTVDRAAFKTLLQHVPGVKGSMEKVMARHQDAGTPEPIVAGTPEPIVAGTPEPVAGTPEPVAGTPEPIAK